MLRRRIRGEFETDEWGFDMEVLEAVKPFMDFMYYKYWRVRTSGLENIPDERRALLIVNHSGQLPWDGAMLGTAVYNEHPSQRLVRTLYATWFPSVPFFSALFTKLGQALGTEDNAKRLLEQEQLVAVFPEGIKGVGKLYKDRYRLARFGRGGFIRMALQTKTSHHTCFGRRGRGDLHFSGEIVIDCKNDRISFLPDHHHLALAWTSRIRTITDQMVH